MHITQSALPTFTYVFQIFLEKVKENYFSSS